MAKAAARGRRSGAKPESSASSRVLEECAGVALLGFSLLALLGLATYSAADPLFTRAEVANRAGMAGALVASLLLRGFGYGSVVLVVATAFVAVRMIIGRPLPPLASRVWVAISLLLVSLATLGPVLQATFPSQFPNVIAGALGGFLSHHELWLVGAWGALMLNGVLFSIGCMSAIGISTAAIFSAFGVGLGWVAAAITAFAVATGRAIGAAVVGIGTAIITASKTARGGARSLMEGIQRGGQSLVVWREQRARRARTAAARESETDYDEPEAEPELVVELEAGDGEAVLPAAPTRRPRGAGPTIIDHRAESEGTKSAKQEAFHFQEGGDGEDFILPDPTAIFPKTAEVRSFDRDSLVMNSRILEKKLKDFGVSGQVATVHPGPVITMYEFEPGSGIKVNKIVGLADDLALALRALSVRVIAPLPGKSVVGIEVANQVRDTVYIRDVLDCDEFRNESSKLAIALGKDIFGNPAHADLAKMPHLLVAGATGTGKSVFLNALLCSILCRATPNELKLLLVDPKLLELSIYEGIPHLLADVVTNPKRASAALAGVVRKMEERYQMMSAVGVRSIAQFNARVDKELAAGNRTFRLRSKPGEEEGAEVEYRRFPYIVVVIDELADLMVVSAKDVEESLQRLAQMARAAGIHLVLATQRPSVDVLTGVIKANFPARISFQVSSRTDSRTILDQNGADHLLGQGDMLFLPPGTSKLQRMHGAFVSEEEVAKLVAALRDQGAPNFDEELIRVNEDGDGTGAERDEDVDEMFDRAVAIVADSRNASISYIQRRLKVGYNRAARMIEQMEKEGMIGPQVGTKSREIFLGSNVE
jgi:S-DNA-T family DNA segregation ATPase FtsK/SpoIIIE